MFTIALSELAFLDILDRHGSAAGPQMSRSSLVRPRMENGNELNSPANYIHLDSRDSRSVIYVAKHAALTHQVLQYGVFVSPARGTR